ncbi:hypothetical protein LYNGBM3L_10480 [Moorena producens 3L]|uniref:Uncharacterized protein n=1 Tax=Moorena producens 3L TaxID=489825 RepID=F4XKP5_9CYAN|nr:hypothetical protein LYNGBM3L_10480 [Moorena producens 3L]
MRIENGNWKIVKGNYKLKIKQLTKINNKKLTNEMTNQT